MATDDTELQLGREVLGQHTRKALVAALDLGKAGKLVQLEDASRRQGKPMRVMQPLGQALEFLQVLELRRMATSYDLVRWAREQLTKLEKLVKLDANLKEAARQLSGLDLAEALRLVKRSALFLRELLVIYHFSICLLYTSPSPRDRG